jgi:DNA-binding CsgD family transcriptional regulator
MAMSTAEDIVNSGQSWLRTFRYAPQSIKFSQVQWLVAQLVACGMSDKEIAYILGISPSTVKAHTGKIIHTLGIWRRSQLVRYIWEGRQFDPEETELLLLRRRQRGGYTGDKVLVGPATLGLVRETA